jgi:hypothetical protein
MRLFGDGKHGHAERIQTFRGPPCHTTFTARRHSPLYRLKTPSHQIAVVLTALAEGLDPSAAERVAGLPASHHHEPFWRAQPLHAQTLHERTFRTLQLPHLQLDELRTRLRCSTQVLRLWLVIDPLTRDSSRPPAWTPHAKRGTEGHPLPATALGSWLPAALHQ